MDNNLKLINSKIKTYKILRFLDISLASLLTLIGTISIVSLLIILNSLLGVGVFGCLILSFILPQIYSVMVNNILLKKIECKINDVLSDIVQMTYDNCLCKTMNLNNKNFESRYEQLSLKNKLKLLYYIKNNLFINSRDVDSYLYSTSNIVSDSLNSDISLENGRSRSRNMNEDGKNNHHL